MPDIGNTYGQTCIQNMPYQNLISRKCNWTKLPEIISIILIYKSGNPSLDSIATHLKKTQLDLYHYSRNFVMICNIINFPDSAILIQLWHRVIRLGLKLCLIGTKCDKSGTFSDQFSVHFGSPSHNEQKTDLKKSQLCPIWCRSGLIWG